MDSFIEFGDFQIADLLFSTNSVEFPPSWTDDNKFTSSLDFFTPDYCCNEKVSEQEIFFDTITNLNSEKAAKSKLEASNKSLLSIGENYEVESKLTFSHALYDNPSAPDFNDAALTRDSKAANVSAIISNDSSYQESKFEHNNDDRFFPSESSTSAHQQVDNKLATQGMLEESKENFCLTTYPPSASPNVMNGFDTHSNQSSASIQNVPDSENHQHERSNGDGEINRRKLMNMPRVRCKPIVVKPKQDVYARHFADEIARLRLVVKPQALQPRGLINSNNWCYVNATLQALLVCPPFFHMLKKLSFTSKVDRRKTSTPIMDSFVLLASEFRTLSFQRCQELKFRKLITGYSFSPDYVYDMLSVIESSLAKKGGQEDAEEFLSCILNGFHEEILGLFDLLYDENESPLNRPDPNFSAPNPEMNGDSGDFVPASTISSRPPFINHTPISNIFRGELCTIVERPGQQLSQSYEAFFTLPIDVPTEHEWSIEDALYSLTEKEGFDQSNKESRVLRHQTIDLLPPVLILHLKRFVYDKNGGLQKVNIPVHFKTDLTIHDEWLTDSARKGYGDMQKVYKLFAVVYHHGEKATGGHYTTDVFHIGKASWLRIDDQNIWQIHVSEVVQQRSSNRTPYLLYYRQMYV